MAMKYRPFRTTDKQWNKAKKKAKKLGVSIAQYIRDLIDEDIK